MYNAPSGPIARPDGRCAALGALLLIAVVTTLNLLKDRDVVETPRRADVTLAAEGGT